MKTIHIFLILIVVSLFACKTEPDICDNYDEVLNGYFESTVMEGRWRFTGGKSGSIIIRGVDYNDMDCGYQIMNCETGEAHFNCEGAGLDKVITIISKDEIKVGMIPYKRVSNL